MGSIPLAEQSPGLAPGGPQDDHLTIGAAACIMESAPAAHELLGTIQVNRNLADTAGHTLWQANMALDR